MSRHVKGACRGRLPAFYAREDSVQLLGIDRPSGRYPMPHNCLCATAHDESTCSCAWCGDKMQEAGDDSAAWRA